MKYKNIFLTTIVILVISTLIGYGQIRKEVKVFRENVPKIEITEDEEFVFPPFGRIVDRLDLSESQEKEFRKLMYDLQKKQTELRAKIRTARIELREIMDSDKPDRNAVEKKIKDIADLKLKIQMNRVDHWFTVNKILDEKQQKIWKQHFLRMGQQFDKLGMGSRKMDRFRHWKSDPPCFDKD